MELTEADNGRRVDVDAADTVVVRLPENPTTGYAWELASLSGPGHLVADRVESGGGAPGAGGWHRFEVAFEGPGDVSLRAVHRRSWEPADSALAEYRLEFAVG